ncbi:MAG: PHP domain-containing protein [Acidobacteria bacterium]|nr:PHP domain-containing protein [Acidobacteriota bacterium]
MPIDVTTSRVPLGRAHLLASSVIREARRAGLGADAIATVGSLRRCVPAVGDVALLAVVPAARQTQVLNAFSRLPIVVTVTARETSSVSVETLRGPVTLHLTDPDQAGAALVWHTGSRAHVTQLQARAERLGVRFAGGHVARATGAGVSCASEQDVYALLDLPYIAPELRSGDGEIEAAGEGRLPRLVSELDIRGDLHMHSTWSDGRNTIADMVSAARQLGYEYIAITDHSERAWSSRKLAAADVDRQREEIDAVRAQARGIEVLHGIEVDIMHDGSLDFDDEVLGRFDIVLASLHDDGGHGRARLTERYLRAIHHPLVNIITHPTNRVPGYSDGYALDLEALWAAAAETGTAMEIDGAPGHLDLDGLLARRAASAGVTLEVGSDSHGVDALGRQMQFGVGTARRGWIEPRHVLNTRSAADVRAFIERKRTRGS